MFRKHGALVHWIMSLTGFHLFPSLLVFGGSVALFVALVVGRAEAGLLDAIALVLGLVAVGFEYVADTQMNEFIKRKEKGLTKETILKTGLWSISRSVNFLLLFFLSFLETNLFFLLSSFIEGTRTTLARSSSGCLCLCLLRPVWVTLLQAG